MSADEILLRESGDRIEHLLAELERSAGPVTWQRVEELIQRTVGLYGAGLERALAHAVGAGARADELDGRLRRDELLSSLLVLHGLHPESTQERVERALDEVRPYLASHAGGVELLSVEEGVVRLRLVGTCDGCPSSSATLEHAIRAAITEITPEIQRVEVDA